jgi:NitT/TauT family transport system substrate-binding protein
MDVWPAGCCPVRRRGRGRVWATAGCAVTVSALLAGCQAPGTPPATGQAPPRSSITVASTPGIGNAALYIAIQQGLFRQAGLAVRVKSYPSAAAEVAALRRGDANVAAGDYANFFYAQEQDAAAPMVVVADGYDAAPNVMDVLVMPGSGITRPQGLAGKTIGTPAPQLIRGTGDDQPYSLETVAAFSALANDGVQPTSVTWKPMPASNLVGALRSHLVDAILVTEPEISQAESQLGAQSILDACSGESVGLPLAGYFATASFAKQHRASLLAFRSVLMRAQADAAQPAPLAAALTHYAGMSRQTASLVTVGTYPTTLKAISLQRVADLMSFYGALPRPLDVAHMILH